MSKFVKKVVLKRKSDQTSKVPNNPTTLIIPSAQKVIAIDDLLKQILYVLPVKSLLRFKSVSKHWHFIISHKDLVSLRNPDPYAFSGLFYQPSSNNCLFWSTYAQRSNLPLEFLPVERDHTHFESITRIPSLSDLIILNSCNGLLLCLGYNELKREGGYQVINPTTKQFHTIKLLQNPETNVLVGVFLAYDPLVSPHYKIVAVRSTRVVLSDYPDDFKTYMVIEIYSSENKSWRICPTEYTVKGPSNILYDGVYWNGAINWLNPWSTPVYFKIDEEHLGTMPGLMVPHGKERNNAQILYYGESNGHLYCAEIYDPTVQFIVYEMKKDYSEWLVKYNVDLSMVSSNFPEMTLIIGRNRYCSYDVLYVEGSFMVLHIPGKFLRYDVNNNSYKIIKEYEGGTLTSDGKYELRASPYIESFSSI